MAIYRNVSAVTQRCRGKSPRVCVVDNQNMGYVLKIPKCFTNKCCIGCCLKSLHINRDFHVTEDEKYLTVRSL